MIFKQKESFDAETKRQLKEYVYDIVGYLYEVYKSLPCGLPEYVYQEALSLLLVENGIDPHKEYKVHPTFKGRELEAFMKLDMMIERSKGNVIIECKALETLGSHERQQLFSYLIGSGFPVGILVNFGSYPNIQIEKYYFDKRDMTITAF